MLSRISSAGMCLAEVPSKIKCWEDVFSGGALKDTSCRTYFSFIGGLLEAFKTTNEAF